MSLSWIYLGHIVESWVNYKNEHVALVDLEALGRWNLAFFEKKQENVLKIVRHSSQKEIKNNR